MRKIIFLVVMLVGLTSCATDNNNTNVNNTTTKTEEKTDKLIWEFVQEDVASNLKSPDTAEFGDVSEAKIYTVSDDTIEVIGVVKGQNALGNSVSNNFCATVLVDKDGKPTMVSNVEFIGDELLDEKIETNTEIENRKTNGIEYLTENELNDVILTQPLYVEETNFIEASQFSYGSDSMMQAFLYNNSDVPIKNAVVGFCAWDNNGLPIKIKQNISYTEGEYFKRLNYDGINVMPNETYNGKQGDTYLGMAIDEGLNTTTIKAIVISYEDFDGNKWENPNLIDFKNLYEEKRIIQ